MKKPKKKPLLEPPKAGPIKRDSLKVGQEIFYLTNYTLDKTKVESVNKDTGIAILENQVKVSLYLNQGFVTPISHDSKAIIRVWSDEVAKEYDYQLAWRNIPTLANGLVTLSKEMGKDNVINIYNKLKKLVSKYGE